MIPHRWPFYGQFYPSSTFCSFFSLPRLPAVACYWTLHHTSCLPYLRCCRNLGEFANKNTETCVFYRCFHVQTDKFYLTTHCCRSHLHCRFPKIRKNCLHLTPGFSWELMCSSIPNIKCVCKTVYVKLCM